MKKLMFLMMIGVALITGRANAQTCDSTVTLNFANSEYYGGAYNQDSFTWHVTADGYINYSLIDHGSGIPDYYESNMSIVYGYGYGGSPQTFYIIRNGGGDISGSLYIGTSTQYLYVQHDTGDINTTVNPCESEYWGDVIVSF